MTDQLALENALFDAEGAAAVQAVVEDATVGLHGDSWAELGIAPRPGLVVMIMTDAEKQAFFHASETLRRAVAEVSRVFYAKPSEAS